jgi:hypothetical protein
LVFSEEFDKEWELFKTCSKMNCHDPIPAEHVIVNSYANGWKIQNKDMPDSFYIYHISDHRLKIGLLVSGISFLLAVVVSVKLSLKKS